jgi:hypothetical protein
MKWTKTHTLNLPPYTVEFESIDNTCKAATFLLDGKPVAKFGDGGYYGGFAAMVPAPPKTEKRWRLTFKLGGTTHTSDHVDKYAAQDAGGQLDSGVEQSIEEVDVEVES